MAGASESEVPDGAAVLPEMPPELGVHPLLLAVLHAVVLLAGSDDEVVDPGAAQEALERIATYLQRLHGADFQRLRADLVCLAEFARQEGWTKQELQFFKTFLDDFGITGEGED